MLLQAVLTPLAQSCGVNKTTGCASCGAYPAYFKAYANKSQPVPVGGSQACPTGTHFPVPCPKCYGQSQFGGKQPDNMCVGKH